VLSPTKSFAGELSAKNADSGITVYKMNKSSIKSSMELIEEEKDEEEKFRSYIEKSDVFLGNHRFRIYISHVILKITSFFEHGISPIPVWLKIKCIRV
jgi:hypothetical protein